MRTTVAAVGAFLAAGALLAQFGPGGQYQGMDPVRVTIEELVRTGMMYNDRPIITQGELRHGDLADQAANIFELEGEETLRTVRLGTSSNSIEDLRFMVGQEVDVSGIFFDVSSVVDPQYHPVLRYFPGAVRRDGVGFDKQYFIAVTGIEPIVELDNEMEPDVAGEESDIVDPDIAPSDVLHVDLRTLVEDPAKYANQRVAVLGKFRGNNLYGDLSIRDKRTPRDFVIKVADAAIWVTGRRPRGDGFRLDPRKRRDTGEWLTVIGKTWLHEPSNNYYLRAEKIEIAEEPDDEDLEPVKVVVPEEVELGPPPEVTFSLPLDGERNIPLDSEFRVQFSNDMKRASFNRNVDLLYADDDGIGNPFPALEVTYDVDTRTLAVLPNKTLEPGKEIRLILYDAIEDEDGQRLVPDPAAADAEPGAAIILTFTTAR